MADQEQEKSEQASRHKLASARKRGHLPRSQEPGIVLAIAASTGYLWLSGEQMAGRVAALATRMLDDAAGLPADGRAIAHWLGALLPDALAIITPPVTAAAGGALVGALAQAGFLFAPDALKADFSRLNPATGIKRLFSMQIVLDAARACIKLGVYCTLAYRCIADTVRAASHAGLTAAGLARTLGSAGIALAAQLLIAAALFTVFDYALVRRRFAKQMRMSRHEIKQEFKQHDGDPRIKQRRRQLQRELLQRSRSLRGIRGADVLVTNPTHYAVGLRYVPVEMAAPTVVSKGAGEFALRLRKLAFIHRVQIVEAPELARQLFRHGSLERDIPPQLFAATAAVYLHVRRTREPAR
ncbi:TPA: EscU/YscU/HrcU family type III secretion system export apparatus switch protein [Burkholderia cenocepacia]|uniref:EscU/YscU/HrcU family type III secretion system export apparatus switch protein n=1 Tax=unclassified Burkholderia TaxID=2613784 RepID=UPI00158C1DE7|nr:MULTISPECIES: EscU/YscU/HrcU family type III secretion system export apparatus switch protein [unclassified Burkholderia]HEF5875125.1 EscU/YscU/HrcU family type III secretion system export apparatus switch protein [Burkholderia cenocepacia]